jgi:hypothetical protein
VHRAEVVAQLVAPRQAHLEMAGLGDHGLESQPGVERDALGTLGHDTGGVVGHGRALNHSGVA